jgi:plastocyanin
MRVFTSSIALLTTAFLAAGQTRQPQAASGYTETNVTEGGTIVGAVSYDGPGTSSERIDVTTKETVCHQDPIYSEKLVVSEDHGVRWAVVSITSIESGKPFPAAQEPSDAPTIDQNGCKFSPHIVVVPKRKPLTILNSDGVLHNVHTWPKKNRSKNVAMPGVFKEMKMAFRRSETFRVTCDIHSWMEGWIVVAENPYTVVTDENGAFTLTDVPPGQYTLRMWHESLKPTEQRVTVRAGEETQVDFKLTKEDRLREGGSDDN